MEDTRFPIAQWVIDRIRRRYPGAALQAIKPGEKHETGCTYWCGYWGQTYTCTAVDHDAPVWGETYTCVWEDGHTTTHSTPLDPRRDLRIIVEEDRT